MEERVSCVERDLMVLKSEAPLHLLLSCFLPSRFILSHLCPSLVFCSLLVPLSPLPLPFFTPATMFLRLFSSHLTAAGQMCVCVCVCECVCLCVCVLKWLSLDSDILSGIHLIDFYGQ